MEVWRANFRALGALELIELNLVEVRCNRCTCSGLGSRVVWNNYEDFLWYLPVCSETMTKFRHFLSQAWYPQMKWFSKVTEGNKIDSLNDTDSSWGWHFDFTKRISRTIGLRASHICECFFGFKSLFSSCSPFTSLPTSISIVNGGNSLYLSTYVQEFFRSQPSNKKENSIILVSCKYN